MKKFAGSIRRQFQFAQTLEREIVPFQGAMPVLRVSDLMSVGTRAGQTARRGKPSELCSLKESLGGNPLLHDCNRPIRLVRRLVDSRAAR